MASDLPARFDRIDQRFDAVDRRFETVDRRFDAVDQRFDAVDRRFEVVDQRFDAIHRRFEVVDQRFDAVESRIDESAAETRRHFDVVTESLVSQIQLVAEGVITVDRKVDRLADEIRGELTRVNRRILALSARVPPKRRR